MAGSHSVSTYGFVAKGAHGSGKSNLPPASRYCPMRKCSHGLGSLMGRTPSIVVAVMTMTARALTMTRLRAQTGSRKPPERGIPPGTSPCPLATTSSSPWTGAGESSRGRFGVTVTSIDTRSHEGGKSGQASAVRPMTRSNLRRRTSGGLVDVYPELRGESCGTSGLGPRTQPPNPGRGTQCFVTS